MCGVPSEGAFSWAMMQYAEVMSLTKNHLTKLQIDTRNAAAISSPLPTTRPSSLKNPIWRQSKISRSSLLKRRSKRESSLENYGNETALLTPSETGINELEKYLASFEGSGRAAWLKAFMHLSNYLRTFHPPPRKQKAISDQKIPLYDIVFNGPNKVELELIKLDGPMLRSMAIKKRRRRPFRCTDLECPVRRRVSSG
ncbi:uncharacterized protein [Venturia canescens]|uniref:uncharacterized protein isoform X2 n=1 Tax=Venturia canescens TaxID=32260 RepID=UPI001C9C09D5|nr:uncharacterized protein LOC122413358 isoform X2 [Venturia canescens]